MVEPTVVVRPWTPNSTAAASREWATPPPNNMWRAAESATIEEHHLCRILCGSPDFFAIFSHPPQQSDLIHSSVRTTSLMINTNCTYIIISSHNHTLQ